MTKMLGIFHHTLTEEQRRDAAESLQVAEVLLPDKNLVDLWANIPPGGRAAKWLAWTFSELA